MSKIEHIKRNHIDMFLTKDVGNISKSDFYQEQIKHEFDCAKSHQRRNELIALNYIWNTFFNETIFTRKSTGKPHCDDFHLSISHHKNYLVVAKSAYPIGIDIEGKRGQLEKIKDKFLHINEKKWVRGLIDLQRIWSIKEVVYKIFDDDQIIFKRDIEVDQGEGNILKARVKRNESIEKIIFEAVELDKDVTMIFNIPEAR